MDAETAEPWTWEPPDDPYPSLDAGEEDDG